MDLSQPYRPPDPSALPYVIYTPYIMELNHHWAYAFRITFRCKVRLPVLAEPVPTC
jgi:hypothetical protein